MGDTTERRVGKAVSRYEGMTKHAEPALENTGHVGVATLVGMQVAKARCL
jgi:hypothetical protein